MFARLFKDYINYNKQLSFDKQITNQLILMLSFTSILSGLVNTIVGFPLWYQLLMYFIGLLGISILVISYYSRNENLARRLFIPACYMLALIAWPNNAGMDGTVPVYLFAIIVFSIAISGKNYLLHFLFNSLFYASLVIISYKYPDFIKFRYETQESRIVDVVLTYFIMGFSIITAIRTMVRNYKEARNRAEQNEIKFGTLFNLSPDPIFIVEKKTGKITDINERALMVYGYTREELIGKPNTFLSAEPDQTLKNNCNPPRYIPERLHRRKNGELFPTEITSEELVINSTQLVVSNVRDISERKNYEKVIKQNETRLKLAVESAMAGIWELDLPSKLLEFNNFYCQMLGYEMSDISKRFEDIVRYIHPNDMEKLRSEVYRMTSHPEKMFQCQVRCLTKDGKWKWVMTYGKVSTDKSGQLSKVTGINIDIDRLMKMQAALESANADKNLFMSILAHDLRGPFSSLLGFSDLLLRNFDKYDNDKILTQLRYINEISHNTYNLLDDLLLWSCSQANSLKFKPVNVNLTEVFSGIIKSMEPAASNKRITLRYSVIENKTAKADPEMLNTILRNLISNSLKFTSEGGEITISSHNNIISVADNGVGISEEDQQKLWNISKVFTSKGTNGETGTGLGLILCKDFIEKHGGKIWVESYPGKGSRFNFTLN